MWCSDCNGKGFPGGKKYCKICEEEHDNECLTNNDRWGYYGNKNKDYIYKNHPTLKLKINPKVDSSQSRVQCSIDIKDIPEEFIIYNSLRDKGVSNIIRDKEIKISISSPPRKRGGISVEKLKNICRENKIKGYTKLNKQAIMDLLDKNNISYI